MPNKKRQGKWLPFDSLEGHRNAIHQTENEVEQEETPELSLDEMEEINNLLIEAFKNNNKVKLEVFNNGKRIDKEGYIIKIDVNNHYVLLDKEKIIMSQIIGIILL